MTARRLPRYLFKLLLLLYIAADFLDPSIPSVFFFEGDVFIDGVVQVKTNAASTEDLSAREPMPLGGPGDCDDGNAATQVRSRTRPLRPQRVFWKNLKHDDSASFASSSPSDSAPAPSQS
jgi:hypothetical protein